GGGGGGGGGQEGGGGEGVEAGLGRGAAAARPHGAAWGGTGRVERAGVVGTGPRLRLLPATAARREGRDAAREGGRDAPTGAARRRVPRGVGQPVVGQGDQGRDVHPGGRGAHAGGAAVRGRRGLARAARREEVGPSSVRSGAVPRFAGSHLDWSACPRREERCSPGVP